MLSDYLPDVLLWIVTGSMNYYKNGLITPESILQNQSDYINELNEDNDEEHFHIFLATKINFSIGNDIKMTDLYKCYKNYLTLNKQEINTPKEFNKQLRDNNYEFKTNHHALYLKNYKMNHVEVDI